MENEYFGLLVGISFLAGLVDSIAGGGGLLTFPALLFSGISPTQAIGTSKFFSTCGVSVAVANYASKKLIPWDLVRAGAVPSAAGALLGAYAILQLDSALISIIVLILLPIAGLTLFLKPKDHREVHVSHASTKAAGLAGLMGFYDGFFGPGTGTFLATGAHHFLGLNLLHATALAKPFNWISNTVSLVMFLINDKVLWGLAIPMAVTNMAGSWAGSHLAVKQGVKFVRKALILVFTLLFVSLAFRTLGAC